MRLLDDEVALHHCEVAREGAQVLVGSGRRRGELDRGGLSSANHLRRDDDRVFHVGWDVVRRLGGCSFGGKGRCVGAFLEQHEVVTHGFLFHGADVFEGQLHLLTGFDLDLLFVELHLVVAADGDFGGSATTFGAGRKGEKRRGQGHSQGFLVEFHSVVLPSSKRWAAESSADAAFSPHRPGATVARMVANCRPVDWALFAPAFAGATLLGFTARGAKLAGMRD